MYFLEGRVQRILNDLEALIYSGKQDITDLQIRYGEIPGNTNPEEITDNWQYYKAGTPWSGAASGEYALFKVRLQIPAGFAGKKAVLNVRTNKSGWNALNPQMLAYIGGRVCQGLDTNHRTILLDERAHRGRSYDIAIYAFSGLRRNYNSTEDDNDVRLYIDLRAAEPLTEEFYYSLKAPLQLAGQLPEGSGSKIEIIDALNEAVNILDLRIAFSKEFYVSLEEANNYLKERLYDKNSGTGAVTCLGHTHIDVAWLWRYCHTREKTVRSFATVLRLMEQYPEYIFMSSQPQLYEFLKEDHPEVYERVRERVKEGRWEPEGGMWVEADTNVPSGESLVRQFLYGKRFFEKEFGKESRILWLPDVFGYSGALPQIMKKSGIEYFMTAKLRNNEFNKFPYHTFMWKGIDGTEILSHITTYSPHFYNGLADQGDILDSWNNYSQKELNDDVLLPYGYGDGGGGPTVEMLEAVRRYQGGFPGSPAARHGKALDYFQRLDKKARGNKRLPKWSGELYYEVHRGTYTSMAKNKRNNRKAEFLYSNAEWSASLDRLLLGTEYPSEQLYEGWKKILLNQFHDVLPGSSIKQVYDDTDLIYSKLLESGNAIFDGCLERIAAAVETKGPSLVIFNPLSWRRRGIVEFSYPAGSAELYLVAPEGETAVCQRVKGNRFIALVRNIPSKGYRTFAIKENCPDEADIPDAIIIGRNLIENQFYRITLDNDGTFTGIFDKKAGREVLRSGGRGNVLQAFEDKPRREDNWNLDIFYSEKLWEVKDVQKIEVLEEGPVRGILKITRKFLNSVIAQDITVYSSIPRIDFITTIDWKEKDIVLKASFPVEINSDRAAYEIQYGYIERNTHSNTTWDIAKFEVCGHKWADLSENGYGVSLLNDCKYGYDIKEGNMRLTLLRSGTIPNPEADKEIHRFTYSLYPHSSDWRQSGTVQEAYDLNNPLTGKVSGQQAGLLPQSFSHAEIDRDNVILETVKQAEDGSASVLRLYEAYNCRSHVNMKFGRRIRRLTECNLMEHGDREISFDNDSFQFDIKPLEIMTFKVEFENT